MSWLRFGTALLTIGLCAADASATSFSIDSWDIGVSLAAGGGNNAGGGFFTVNNPFSATVSRTLLNSMSQAAFDFLWTSDAGDFSIASTLTNQGPISASPFGSESSGGIHFTAVSALTFQPQMHFSYSLASGDRECGILLEIYDQDSNTQVHEWACGARLIDGDPPVGTCDLGDLISLPAPRHYWIVYRTQFESYSGSPSILSTGNSTIQFHLEGVPEPATLALLGGACLALGCRIRTRHDASGHRREGSRGKY